MRRNELSKSKIQCGIELETEGDGRSEEKRNEVREGGRSGEECTVEERRGNVKTDRGKKN